MADHVETELVIIDDPVLVRVDARQVAGSAGRAERARDIEARNRAPSWASRSIFGVFDAGGPCSLACRALVVGDDDEDVGADR